MKIYPKLIPALARDIVNTLVAEGDIEIAPNRTQEAEKDLAAIMREYVSKESEVRQTTKDFLAERGWGHSKFAEIMHLFASTRNFPLGDDGLDFVINQILEFMMISSNFEEVFANDLVMRKRILTIIRRYENVYDEVDNEVRRRLKHLEEGTSDWEIQYEMVKKEVQRNKRL